jgi:D-alanyl-D-alanine carboxypeptidase (penicillin-binding protein 5/6)
MKQFIFCFVCMFLAAALTAQSLNIQSRSAVLMDATTGVVLFTKAPHVEIPPASLAKLMTVHIVLSEIDAGAASLDEIVDLPRESWWTSQPYGSSLMWLNRGQKVTLQQLLLGLTIHSGNDAAVAVALRFASSVEDFADRMNTEARRMGLSKTFFVEPSGISGDNMTTALEFALFCREYIRLHPEALKNYHSVREFSYPPGESPHYNHNTLLDTVPGVDGLKTGYIDESGYNIALTADINGTRLIAVVLGAPVGTRIRDEDGRKLLEFGFEHYKTVRPAVGLLEPARVWMGKTNQVPVDFDNSKHYAFTTTVDRAESIQWRMELEEPIKAPLPSGTVVGTLIFYDHLSDLEHVQLFTTEPVEKGGFFKRLFDQIQLWFRSISKQGK